MCTEFFPQILEDKNLFQILGSTGSYMYIEGGLTGSFSPNRLLKSRFWVVQFYCMPKVSVCCLKQATTYSMCEYENINPSGMIISLQVNILTVTLK